MNPPETKASEQQKAWAMQKGLRESDAITLECLAAIQELLRGKTITVRGNEYPLVLVGAPHKHDDGSLLFMFDIRGLTGFADHIEFCVTKTGWGGSL